MSKLSLLSPAQAACATLCEDDVPLAAARAQHPLALAIITGVVGASYRPRGAMMVIDGAGRTFGNLSSGCIERDVALHGVQAIATGQAKRLRYGAGSPYQDLRLPCGGGLDILILPHPDPIQFEQAARDLAARRTAQLDLLDVQITILPTLRFLIFGKGPETRALSHLAAAAGYLVETFSPDPETLQDLPKSHLLLSQKWPEAVGIDARTAVALFFHDHDWEPPLLQRALRSDAFYVGAQGSKRAHDSRCAALGLIGLSEAEIARMAAPFGLIPSVRDPKTLAVSVLAHVIDRAQGK